MKISGRNSFKNSCKNIITQFLLLFMAKFWKYCKKSVCLFSQVLNAISLDVFINIPVASDKDSSGGSLGNRLKPDLNIYKGSLKITTHLQW